MRFKPKRRRSVVDKKIIFFVLIFCFIAFFGNFLYKSNANRKFFVKNSMVDAHVHFVDVGQGDCELIFDGGKTVLIDCGEVDKGCRVVRHLKKCGVKKIDYFIGTHPHTDHYGGFVEVAKHFKIKNVILPKIMKDLIPTNPIYERFLRCLFSKNINLIEAKSGKKIRLGRGELQILGPLRNDYDELNDFSVVTRFVYGSCSFLLCGDAQKDAEFDLLKSGQNLSADVFKLNHHGSKTSNTKKFLKAVGAKTYVATVGKHNSYGHPHKKVLKSLNGKKLYRTDFDGTIFFRTDGKLIEIETEKKVS